MSSCCYSVFSGGLDSTLSVRVLQSQGIEVKAVNFVSNFYGYRQAKESAKKLGVELKVLDITPEMLEIVKNPRSGYGKHMNPCIDCHAFMIRRVKEEFVDKCGDNCLVATGEVLSQRPFSQNRSALERVEKLAGVEVLRPLSAKLLPPTSYEEYNLVDREKLLDIRGRSRERQRELASYFGIEDYPNAAGGCLLTDPSFSMKVGQMVRNWPCCTPVDIELLKNGRVFWASRNDNERILIMVARNKQEGDRLTQLMQPGDLRAEMQTIPGPVILVRGLNTAPGDSQWIRELLVPMQWEPRFLDSANTTEDILSAVALMAGYYKKNARGRNVEVKIEKQTGKAAY